MLLKESESCENGKRVAYSVCTSAPAARSRHQTATATHFPKRTMQRAPDCDLPRGCIPGRHHVSDLRGRKTPPCLDMTLHQEERIPLFGGAGAHIGALRLASSRNGSLSPDAVALTVGRGFEDKCDEKIIEFHIVRV